MDQQPMLCDEQIEVIAIDTLTYFGQAGFEFP